MRHRAPGPGLTLRTDPLLRLQALLIVAVTYAGIAVTMTADRAVSPAAGSRASAPAALAAAPLPGVLAAPAPGLTPAPRPGIPALPTGKPAAKPAAPPAAKAKRWLPQGTGMWTYLWERTEGGNARKVVARAQAMGLTHLYVRTGTRKGGFDGGPVLARLLPATKGTDIKVIAWDFPQLANPAADAARLAAAARFVPPGQGTPRVAAVAPDIETAAEGTKLSTVAVDRYYRELRRRLPADIAILATVPWPSEKRLGKYPYEITARHADALVPMAYWINRDPVTVTRQSMARLGRYGKPVMPVGQAYDPRIDVPTLRWGPPSGRQIAAFARTARAAGAQSVSLWVWNTASGEQWGALSASRRLFQPAPAARPAPRPAAVPKPTKTTPPRPRARSTEVPDQAQRSDY